MTPKHLSLYGLVTSQGTRKGTLFGRTRLHTGLARINSMLAVVLTIPMWFLLVFQSQDQAIKAQTSEAR
jgi:hypothetical protein